MTWARAAALTCGLALSAACQPAARSDHRGGPPAAPPPTPGLGPADTVPPDLAPATACADAPLLTLAQVARGERAGERVAFDAVPEPQVMCTAMACMSATGAVVDDACCNTCGGGYGLEHPHEFRLRFEGFAGCTGYDCNLACAPFGRAPTRAYRFVGTSTWAPRRTNGAIYDTATFAVERVCAVD